MSSNVGYEDEVVKPDLPESLIYANADEFHVKSTVLYASGDGILYLDKEYTKPVYSDKLERLFLAGGLKIAGKSKLDGVIFICSPNTLTFHPERGATVVAGGMDWIVPVRPTSDSSDSKTPVPEEEVPSHQEI